MVTIELREKLASDCRYATTKMESVSRPENILFYFTIVQSSSQRILNRKWDKDVALIEVMCQITFKNLTSFLSEPARNVYPIDTPVILNALTRVTNDLATYLEGSHSNTSKLYNILCHLAEINYAASGNGSYLYERGDFTL